MAAEPQDPWYSNFGVMVSTAGVLLLGGLYMIVAKPYDHGAAPAGDAHRLDLSAAERSAAGGAQVIS